MQSTRTLRAQVLVCLVLLTIGTGDEDRLDKIVKVLQLRDLEVFSGGNFFSNSSAQRFHIRRGHQADDVNVVSDHQLHLIYDMRKRQLYRPAHHWQFSC